jgi:hypothetical protein
MFKKSPSLKQYSPKCKHHFNVSILSPTTFRAMTVSKMECHRIFTLLLSAILLNGVILIAAALYCYQEDCRWCEQQRVDGVEGVDGVEPLEEDGRSRNHLLSKFQLLA